MPRWSMAGRRVIAVDLDGGDDPRNACRLV